MASRLAAKRWKGTSIHSSIHSFIRNLFTGTHRARVSASSTEVTTAQEADSDPALLAS